MTNSFFPAAQRVAQNPMIRWLGGILLAMATAALTTGVWPFFRGWVATRADVQMVESISSRVSAIEQSQAVNFERLNSANGDDTGALTESEQLQWALIRIKRMQQKLVSEVRARIRLEALLRMPNPRSDAARRTASSVTAKFDDLVFKGEDPLVAGPKALEFVYGTNTQ